MFSTGLNKIYESISKTAEKDRAGLLNTLQEKIVKSPVLSYKYELLESIKANKNSLNKEQAAKFVAKLKEAHTKVMAKNNTTAVFYREEKALFEYFNINQREVVSSKLDIIIGKKDNELNESVILEYVTNPNLKTGKEAIMEAKASQKEDYRAIRAEGNLSAFERKMATLSAKAVALKGKRKELVESSIKALKTEAYTDFNSACDKAFKLNILTEKYLHEDWNDDYFMGANIPTKADGVRSNQSDEDYEEFEDAEDPSLKNYSSSANYSYLTNVVIGYPNKYQAEYITINFKIPVYPTVTNYSDGLVQMPKYRKMFLSLKSTFVRQGLMKTGSKILSISDVVWDANIPVNIDKSVFEKAITNQTPYSMEGKFEVTVQIAVGADSSKYIEVAERALQNFDAVLDEVPGMSQIVSPAEQLEMLSTATTGRKTSYDNRENDKYYKDTHSKNFVDDWADDHLIGDAEESTVKNAQDKQFYGDSKKNYKPNADTEDDNSWDDDAIDKMATAKAKGR